MPSTYVRTIPVRTGNCHQRSSHYKKCRNLWRKVAWKVVWDAHPLATGRKRGWMQGASEKRYLYATYREGWYQTSRQRGCTEKASAIGWTDNVKATDCGTPVVIFLSSGSSMFFPRTSCAGTSNTPRNFLSLQLSIHEEPSTIPLLTMCNHSLPVKTGSRSARTSSRSGCTLL